MRADGETVHEGAAWQVIVAVTGAFGGGSQVGAADPADGVLDVAILPAGSRLGLARRAWGLKRGHDRRPARRRPPPRRRDRGRRCRTGAEFNADGEVRERGLERVTVERDAYVLVVG